MDNNGGWPEWQERFCSYGVYRVNAHKEIETAMNKIAIITDTDSSIPPDVAAKNHIHQVPIVINFGKESYETWKDIDDERLFERIDREGVLPTTAAPSPGKFAAAYQTAFDDGAEQIVCFTVSSGVSATYNAALTAASQFPDREIRVVDTQSLTMGQGFIVLEAARKSDEGADIDEIVAVAEDIRSRTHLYFALPTLKYLAMSGRVGYLAAGMATILNIKPILTVRDGKLDLLEKVRTKGKSWARVVELCEQALGDGKIKQMAMVHVNVPDDARQLETLLRERVACPEESMHVSLGAGLSVHAGAGLVGVTFVTER